MASHRWKNILGIIYFLVLFFILGSYIYVSLPDDMIRLHITTADKLSKNYGNIVGVNARNLNNGSVFENWALCTFWIDPSGSRILNPGNGLMVAPNAAVCKTIAVDGEDWIQLPPMPDEPVSALEVSLLNRKDFYHKSALISIDTFSDIMVMSVPEQPVEPRSDVLFIDAPGAFMLGVPNEVRIIAYEDGKPYVGMIEIEQTYGVDAGIPHQIKASPSGISTFTLSIDSPVDIKVTAGKQIMYQSFVIHEKTLNAKINATIISPRTQTGLIDNNPGGLQQLEQSVAQVSDDSSSLEMTVTPVGMMPSKLYIDYFDGDAWIDRQVVRPTKSYGESFVLKPNINNENDLPVNILYVRVSTSAIATPESSQSFAIPVFGHQPGCRDAAMESLQFLEPYKSEHPELELMKIQAMDHRDCKDLVNITREAMDILARHHNPNLAVRVRTENMDAMAYDARKIRHKSIANIILVGWFTLGVITGTIIVFIQMRRRKEYWARVAALGEAEMTTIPAQVNPLLLILVFLLAIGLCVSLYYMMQLL